MTFIPYLNLILAILLPIVFWIKDKKQLLLFWIIFNCFTDIIGNQIWLNLSGFKVTGLVLAPLALMHLKDVPKSLKKTVIIYLIWNVIRSLFEITNDPFSISKQIGTQFANCSNLIILIYLLKEQGLDELKRFITYTVIIVLIGGLIEYFFRFDLFHFFTGGRELLLHNRLRGFSYEPRAFGYSMAVAIVFILTFLTKNKIPLLIFSSIGLAASASISSAVLLLTGVLIVVAPKLKDARLLFCLTLTLGGIYFFGDWLTIINEKFFFYWRDLSGDISLIDIFIKLHEPAEAAVLNYLKSNPLEIFLGMGAGAQVYLVKPFILVRDYAVWGRSMPLLPAMGYLLIISNIGILGFIYYCVTFWIKPMLVIFKPQAWQLFSLSIFFMFLLQSRNFHVIGLAITWTLFSEKKTVLPSLSNPKVA